ncbi:ASP1 [Symbiodinium natans]|uniref:ASP1 protein n=1 Tax=Symbiodinium natans TaxID=878477 RepID=A0A812KIE0_9DINO|nr:ASP1 [Symbiodinium natans]
MGGRSLRKFAQLPFAPMRSVHVSTPYVVPNFVALWLAHRRARRQASFVQNLALRQERFYEVVVCNLSGRPLVLQGCRDPAARKSTAGSFLRLVTEIAPLEGAADGVDAVAERLLLHNPVTHPSPAVQARFQHHGSCGDLLEFSVTYLTTEGTCFMSYKIISFLALLATSIAGFETFVMIMQVAHRPRVLIIATGGTIDKAYPRVTGGWGFEIGEPAATRILDRISPAGFSFEVQSVCAKDSQEISEADRLSILKACEDWSGDQVIITHGTDTLIETACFLGKHAGKLATKCICLTGAMLPEKFVDTDAHFNMGVCFGALNTAMPGIYVCMNGRVREWTSVGRDLRSGAFAEVQDSAH